MADTSTTPAPWTTPTIEAVTDAAVSSDVKTARMPNGLQDSTSLLG